MMSYQPSHTEVVLNNIIDRIKEDASCFMHELVRKHVWKRDLPRVR